MSLIAPQDANSPEQLAEQEHYNLNNATNDAAKNLANADLVFVPPLISSIATVLRLRGRKVSYNQLVAGLPGGFKAPTTAACLRAAAAVGLQNRIIPHPKISNILSPTLPCILLLNIDSNEQQSSCVLTHIDEANNQVELIFPETEPEAKIVKITELEAIYSGTAVFVTLDQKADSRVDSLELVKPKHWFWDVLLNYLPIYRDVGMASFVINLLTLASPLFIMNVYDRVVPNNAIETLWVLAIGLLIAHCMDFMLRNLRSHFVDMAGRNADVIIATQLMDKVLNMRLDNKPDSVGGLANNLREFEQVREFFGSTTLIAIIDLPFLFLFIALVAYIGGPLAMMLLLALPLMLGFVWLIHIPFQRATERQFKQNMQKNSLLVEIIGGLETIKSTLAHGHMRHLWANIVDSYATENGKTRRLANLANSGNLFITYIINAGVIIWGVYRITEGLMTQGGLIACVILVGRALGPLMQLAAMLTQLQKSRVALNALNIIMNLPDERTDSKQGELITDFSSLAPSLRIENISFKYPNTSMSVLKDFSLQIKAGERVGFIGQTGSGKSTLARLITGLYQPLDGNIQFAGIDIRQINNADLRSRISFMPQDNYLFYGSVLDNIVIGSPLVDEKRLLKAAEIAGVMSFVNKHPLGLGMPVGERGNSLSGGQRQSVALARSLIRNSDIYILDEPSSNLDVEAEQLLIQRLKIMLHGKSLLLMTHRMSLLRLVDRVVVLKQGAIIADGPRDAVINALNNGQLRGKNNV